ALDLQKIEAAGADLEKQTANLDKEAQKWIDDLQKGSPIATSQTSLRSLHNTIIKAYASL
ncbi:MAG: hypothetical protein K0S68_729, partial [Candidatus Saccharibacteria bacterium]|nr:hypothetical protein [Candidatus Saccharibacteria bacterium]